MLTKQKVGYIIKAQNSICLKNAKRACGKHLNKNCVGIKIMKRKLLGICPVCGEKLSVTELGCGGCGTKISGNFKLSKFDYLPEDLQNFALIFLKNAGNIKAVENEMNISYPTVKKYLESLIEKLDFDKKVISVINPAREDVLKMLKNGEINFDEAEDMLKNL